MYHSHMLEAAKKISNVNEFVYLAKEISRMLKEEVNRVYSCSSEGGGEGCRWRWWWNEEMYNRIRAQPLLTGRLMYLSINEGSSQWTEHCPFVFHFLLALNHA